MSITVSTVTPVYRGALYLEDLVKRIELVRDGWEKGNSPLILEEAIFVIDAAIDDSAVVLQKLAAKYSWLSVITLSRNFGQHAATAAGICHTSSDWIVTLDEDLQHDPADIDLLFSCQAREKVDIVYASPKQSVHGGWRDKSSALVKNLISYLTATPQISYFNSFRLLRGSIARAAASSSRSGTYLDIALSWFTKLYASVQIEMKDDRYAENKVSGYQFLSLVNHARRLMLSSHVDVASVGLLAGLFSICLAFGYGAYAVIQKIFFPSAIELIGWASTISAITFFGGVIIALACVLLEYVSSIAINQLGKPTFFIIDRSKDKIILEWCESGLN